MRRLALCLALAGWLVASLVDAEPLSLTVTPLEHFAPAGVGEPKAPLEFLGGLRLASDNKLFGGLSGIDMLDADTALMIGDTGITVRARLVHENGRLVGLNDAEIDSLFPNGDMEKRNSDAEDVALDPADRTHGVLVRERQANAMLTFDLIQGLPANFKPKPVGADNRVLRSNTGLESVAYAPPASPLSGEIVAIAEEPPKGMTDIPGWVAGVGAFSVVQRDGFAISSARFLPDGDLLLLERRFAAPWGLSMRLRRIAGATVKVGARLDSEVLLEAGMASEIDNMEGLAVSQDDAGRTLLTLVSDDNFNILQRTLILEFALVED